MLKTRVIPLLLIQDGLIKKRIRFEETRTIANPVTIARVFEARRSDELIILDIGKTVGIGKTDPQLIMDIAEELQMPFAYGGGITSLAEITDIIKHGAEKVVLNTAAVENPALITQAATKFGNQCVVISIDAKKKNDGSYEVYTRCGTQATGLHPRGWARQVEELGAGEILINCIDHEGVMQGYNIELIKMIAQAVKIPVIAAGGAGKLDDFVAAVKEGRAAAVAAGSIFLYTSITPDMVKERLRKEGIAVRMQSPEFEV